jgi:hypothetical protein
MSYQAQRFVRNIRGISRGEKTLLMALSYYHDSRDGQCRASHAELAIDSEMTERHVIRLIDSLVEQKIIAVTRGNGRGKKTEFVLVGMAVQNTRKGDICDSKRVTFEAGKGDISDTHIRKKVLEVKPKAETHPNPPFLRGRFPKAQNQKSQITVRDRRKLNELIYRLMGKHLDQFGHQVYEGGIPLKPIDFQDAMETACAELLLPLNEAWEVMTAAGLGDGRKKPQQAVTA